MLQQSNNLWFVCNNQCLMNGIEMLYLQNIMLHENYINSFVNGCANMSDMMCHDHFVGHRMSHSNHVCFLGFSLQVMI